MPSDKLDGSAAGGVAGNHLKKSLTLIRGLMAAAADKDDVLLLLDDLRGPAAADAMGRLP